MPDPLDCGKIMNLRYAGWLSEVAAANEGRFLDKESADEVLRRFEERAREAAGGRLSKREEGALGNVRAVCLSFFFVLCFVVCGLGG